MGEVLSLGLWIRRRRKALDLTLAELAGQVGCSAELLRKIETDARRPSRQVAVRLGQHLQLAPHECDMFVRAARAELATTKLPAPLDSLPRPSLLPLSAAPLHHPAHNLPAMLTPLIGRDSELADLAALLLNGARLITITGPGGVGKTRLALELVSGLAANPTGSFPDGLWLIDLASTTNPALVAPAITRVVGAPEPADLTSEESLKVFLRSQRALLLLDNFEHLLDAAPLVHQLLTNAPGLCVIATSRSPLGLNGEHVRALKPLPETLAVALFDARARQARADFTLTPASRDMVAMITRRLDGLPLAIELAAAWVRLFEPLELLARLVTEGSLPLLASGVAALPKRQQTLRATLEWSYALLPEAEQALLARLGVFTGGFTLDAAATVCGFGSATVTLLATLVDQSLVYRTAAAIGETRFALLAMVQEFAREALAASGAAAETHRRHASWVLRLAEEAEPQLLGAQQGEWRQRLKAEHENISAALAWSLSQGGDPIIGLGISGALLWYWKPLGYRREGLMWLEATLARCANAEPDARATALHAAGTLAGRLGNYALAMVRLEEAQALCQMIGNIPGMLDNLLWLSRFAREQGDYERAQAQGEEGLALARQHRLADILARVLQELGDLALEQGDYERALRWYQEALPAVRQSGDLQSIGWILANVGRAMLAQGNAGRAEELYAESQALFEQGRLSDGVAWMRYEIGRLALQRGEDERAASDFVAALAKGHSLGLPLLSACALEGLATIKSARHPERSARLLAAASTIRAEVANPPTLPEQAELTHLLRQLRSVLGTMAFEAAWKVGSSLSWDEVKDEALA